MKDAERVRPIKQFEVIVAYGPYLVGQKIQPTGLYRDILLRRGVIKEVVDSPPDLIDRMVTADQGGPSLFNRKGRKGRG